MRYGRRGPFERSKDAMSILVIKKQAGDFFDRHYQGFNTLVVRI